MQLKIPIKTLFLLTFIFFAFTASATNYYLSNSGNNANSGISASTSWKTLGKINSSTFLPGDSILFKRGDTWREILMVPSGGTSGNPIVFSAYGTGEKPRILGSEIETSWINVSGNIWESSNTFSDPYAISSYHANIYFIESDGSITWGRVKKSDTTSLASEYDWTYNSNHIYIYSPTDPNTRYSGVEITQRNICIRLFSREYLTIDGLEIAYSGNYGIAESGSESNLNGLTIKNCHIHHIGIKSSGEAYGIESFYSNTLIQNNEINDCGRRNISLNLYSGTAMHNVIVEGNTLYHGFHTTGVDISSLTTGTIDSVFIRDNYIYENVTTDIDNVETYGSALIHCANEGTGSVSNIYIYDNILKDNKGEDINLGSTEGAASVYIYNNTIYGVSPYITATYMSMIDVEAGTNCTIKNNIFYNNVKIGTNPTYSVINILGTAGTVISDYNLYYNTTATRLMAWYGTSYSTSQWASYKSASGQDAHSILGSDPLFINSTNYHLQSTSPAINAGTNVGLPYNGTAPDMGAYENSINIPPNANAGLNQTITLPTNSVKLNGSGTDVDGTISSYVWTKISGPSGGTINNANSASTTVTGLVQGIYLFELKVTDNNGVTGKDTMQLTVNTALNQPPTANAGVDLAITLPTNTVTLNGSGKDTDGTVSIFFWTKISGPSSFNITNTASPTTDVSGLLQGVYEFELQVIDNNGAVGSDTVRVTVNAAANIVPVANAGSNKTITLPVNSVILSGSGSDTDGTVVSYLWTKISGPSTYNIVNASYAATAVSGLVQGVYQLELKVTDDKGAVGKDTVQITVTVAPNIPPTADAGSNQSITLPINTITINGSGSDSDGTISSYLWIKISGPSSGTINNANSTSVTINNLSQGVYEFELNVTDDQGAIRKDTVQITVNPAANISPTANAGGDKTITLPTNTVSLSGNGTDPDGTIASYSWTKISGPSAFSISNSSSTVTTVSGLLQGVYQFELKVTDDKGAVGKDTIQITVNPAANISPTANAGGDKTITLPTNTVSLFGNGTDADGTISSYSWAKISGPSAFSIKNASSPTSEVAGLVEGVYLFELKVTDNNGAQGNDTVKVTVKPANNIPPVAQAGSNQTITLPTNTISLNGNGVDSDGTISTYLWTKIAGPATGTITDASSAFTTVKGLIEGNYIFQLTVTDNVGAKGTDTLYVTVYAPKNIAPIANAGGDLTIVLPVNSVYLNGSGSDIDGTITAYQWKQIAGPGSASITTDTNASSEVKNLVGGTYEFELSVTDNNEETGSDTVNVVVALGRISGQESNSIIIYPNPVKDIATVEINSENINSRLTLFIVDFAGKIVYKKQINSPDYKTTEKINMSTFSKGSYTISVFFNGTDKQIFRIIKL